MSGRSRWLSSLALIGAAALASGSGPGEPIRDRRPVALAFSGDGAWLYAANSRNGTISAIDVRAGKVGDEVEVGRGLADLAALPDGRHLLAVDRLGDALIVLESRSSSVSVGKRLAVAADRSRS